ncbi:hypothetical protein [Marinicella sediminis]|nr:hypothetical protein [Marinicella sediminis]
MFGMTTTALAKGEVSLNDAVNQAKADGQVLTAKTINGRHEIKVLTPSGKVRTITRDALQNSKNDRQRTARLLPDSQQNNSASERMRQSRSSHERRINQRSSQRTASRQVDRTNSSSAGRNKQSKSKKDK